MFLHAFEVLNQSFDTSCWRLQQAASDNCIQPCAEMCAIIINMATAMDHLWLCVTFECRTCNKSLKFFKKTHPAESCGEIINRCMPDVMECHGIFPDQPWKLLEMYGHLAKRRCANTAGFSIGMASNLWEGPVVTAFSDELLCLYVCMMCCILSKIILWLCQGLARAEKLQASLLQTTCLTFSHELNS